MKIRVTVMPKESVLDPQGVAVRNAMLHLGVEQVGEVRIGKVLEFELPGSFESLEAKLHEVCHDLLSNPVIEDYRLEVLEP